MHARIRSAALGLAAALLVTQAGLAQQAWKYPATATVEHVDTYHGVQIADPYRWLEDDNSAQTTQCNAAADYQHQRHTDCSH